MEARRATATSDDETDEADRHSELAAFYETYQQLLAEAGAVDFGDQIARALGLLRARPSVLARLRERYRYVLVDEFQDTNHAQLELVRLLAGPDRPNITVVGDDDQAIYRWRGAAAANLLAFRRLYADAREVVLTENHRSTQVILDAASRLIAYNNPYRLEVIAGIDKRVPAGATLLRGERDDTFRGSHRGYERLTPPVSHTREIVVDKTAARVVVRDRLDGAGKHACSHIEQQCAVSQHGERRAPRLVNVDRS